MKIKISAGTIGQVINAENISNVTHHAAEESADDALPTERSVGQSATALGDTPAAQAPSSPEGDRSKASVSILLVCASPRGAAPLRLDTEERALREAIRLATHRERFSISVLNAATIDDLRRELLRQAHQIVQFSGHGTSAGLQFEDSAGEVMEPDSLALARLLRRRGVNTVILNACDSLGTALAGTSMLDYIVAMDGPLDDAAAIEFSRGFYDALGEGKDVPEAFDEGIACCKLKRLPVNALLLRSGESPGR